MLYEKLTAIQKTLKVPKMQHNSFGNYDYRSAEDILEAVKPLLIDVNMVVSDEVVNIGSRYYVKATVKLTYNDEKIEVTAYAREEETRKGMDGSQITGSASSYARKYGLNGMFLIDDVRDADTRDNTKTTYPVAPERVSEKAAPCVDDLRTMKSKYASTCNICQKPIIVGSDIVYNSKNKKAMHAVCFNQSQIDFNTDGKDAISGE